MEDETLVRCADCLETVETLEPPNVGASFCWNCLQYIGEAI